MQRDDDDDGIESAARRLERGNKTSPDEAKKQLRQQLKKQERIQKITKLQLQVAKQKEGKSDTAKTKTHEEEAKEKQQASAEKKQTVEDQIQQETEQKAMEQASPYEYQQDAG